ncbi:MAG: hypothetical protein AAB797_01715, partial [Patescibacteria group bacterium]
MFGKKAATNSEIDQTISVQTIPADFYGGINPVVKFKKVEKEVVLQTKPKLSAPEKKMLDKSTAAGSGVLLHPANILTNKKYAIIFGSSLFVAIVAGVSVYYYIQLRQQAKPSAPAAPQISVSTPTPPPEITEPSPTEVVVPTTTESAPSLAEAPIDFPSALLGDSPDLDKDNLTDTAEELFGADPSKPDTDEDSYNDGHEVFYLYNPAGKEPQKLIDSGYVNDYINSVFGYKVYYPLNWAIGNVDESGRDVLFSTITGENIELRVFDRLPNQTFADWFAQRAPNEQYQNLVDFQTRFTELGKNRADNLVYYFMDDTRVYVMIYHTTDSNVVNYRSVMVMMARSFRSVGFTPPEIIPPTPETSVYPAEMPSSINP